MFDELRPVEDLITALKTPINLAGSTSINRAANSINLAAGTQIRINDGYFSNQLNSIAGKGHIVYMKTDDMLYSGGNGTGLSFYLKYAENSTEDDPIVVAKGIDENGEKFEQTIHINKINPKEDRV